MSEDTPQTLTVQFPPGSGITIQLTLATSHIQQAQRLLRRMREGLAVFGVLRGIGVVCAGLEWALGTTVPPDPLAGGVHLAADVAVAVVLLWSAFLAHYLIGVVGTPSRAYATAEATPYWQE